MIRPIFLILEVEFYREMEEIHFILRLVQVCLAALIATIPPLSSRILPYIRKAKKGYKKLSQIRREEGDLKIGWLEKEEKGFKEILKSLKKHYPVKEKNKVNKVCLAEGKPSDFKSIFDRDFYGAFPNTVLFLEYEGGRDPELISFHGYDPERPRKEL